jgi:hypothetical protein
VRGGVDIRDSGSDGDDGGIKPSLTLPRIKYGAGSLRKGEDDRVNQAHHFLTVFVIRFFKFFLSATNDLYVGFVFRFMSIQLQFSGIRFQQYVKWLPTCVGMTNALVSF